MMELYIWLGEYEPISQRYLDFLPPGFDTICDDYDNEERSEAGEEGDGEDDGEENNGEYERKLRPPIALIYSGFHQIQLPIHVFAIKYSYLSLSFVAKAAI